MGGVPIKLLIRLLYFLWYPVPPKRPNPPYTKNTLWRKVNETWLDDLNSCAFQRNARAHRPIWILLCVLFSKHYRVGLKLEQVLQPVTESSRSYHEVFKRKGSGKRKQAAEKIASDDTREETEAKRPRGGEVKTQPSDPGRKCTPLNTWNRSRVFTNSVTKLEPSTLDHKEVAWKNGTSK